MDNNFVFKNHATLSFWPALCIEAFLYDSDQSQSDIWGDFLDVDCGLVFFLVFLSLDESEEQLESFLKELPKKSLFLAYEDPYRRWVGLTS